MELLTEGLTTTQAALRLGVSAQWVQQLCDRGTLTSIRTAHGRLVDPESVDRLRERREAAAKEAAK